jgi:autotransporter-associated beta strand protein
MKQKIHQSFNTFKYSLFILAFYLIIGKTFGQQFWKTDGTSSNWISSNWGTSGAGPFGNAWVSGSGARFTANSSITFATTVVGNVIVDPGLTVTVSQAGTASGATVRTYSVGTGSTLNWLGQNLSASAGFGVIKDGAGIWNMGVQGNNFNSTNGGFKLNAGTVISGGDNCYGGSNSILTINGGTIQSSGATRNYSNLSIIIGGDFGLTNVSNNTAFSGAINLGGAHRTVTYGDIGNYTFGGVISNGAISYSAGVAPAGVFRVSSTANTYTGTTSFLGGEVEMAGDRSFGAVPGSVNPGAIIINGGRMTFTASAFTLNSNRGIKVGSGSNNSISVKSSATSVSYNGIISDLTTNGSWAKQGSNILILGGASIYTGATAINNGTLQLSGNNRLPITTTLTLGQSGSANTGTFNLSNFHQEIVGLSSTTGLAFATKNNVTSTFGPTLTINATNNYTYGLGTTTNSGIISGAITVVKNGSGIQTLGDINTYTGRTQINAGELRFSPNLNENLSSSAVTLNGGILGTTGITNGVALSFSTLNLADNSIISLETNNPHRLAIATSSSVSWVSTKTLTITGWQGNYCGSGTATKGKITIGTNSLSLTSSQLAQILFYDGTNYYPAKLSTTGELIPNGFPIISVPASSNSPLCSGNTLLLNVTAKGTPLPVYTWAGPNSFTASSQVASLTNAPSLATGIYTVTATNSCGTATSAVAVTVNTTPTLSAISSINICPNKYVTTTFTTNPTGSTYNWSNTNTSVGIPSSGTGNFTFYSQPQMSDQTAIVTVTPQLNGCIGLSQSYSVTVKAIPTSSSWTGAISSDWFDPDNWTNCACGSITNGTITSVASPSFNPIISGPVAVAYANNLEINSTASLSVQSTQMLVINGDFINNGSFSSAQGVVILSGPAIQKISGTNSINFYNLQLYNSAGVILTNEVGIKGSLDLAEGSLSTNGKLTLLADTFQTGRIGPINANADIIGDVNIQQLAKGGSTGWALFGAPIASNITMADWNDDFAITCASCPDGSQSGFTSIYEYSETAAGSFSSTAKYVPITSISNSITVGQGYWVYLGNGYPNTTNIVFDVSGTIAKSSCLSCTSSISIPVTYTNNNPSADDNGWNLISNPLPSPISWHALLGNNSYVDNAIYAFNTDFLSGSGDYTSYVNGVSSDLTGGIGDEIPMCQAFFIHATAATTLIADEHIKVSSNQVLLKNNSISVKPIARLVMNGGNSSLTDMTTLYFESGATNLFEKNYDAYKLINDPTLPYIGTLSSNELTGINGLPDLSSNISVPVKAIVNSTHSYTFSILKSDFPTSVCINLYDSYTGISTNLSNSTYSCLLYDTTDIARFSLNFTTLPLSGTTISNQPVCSAPNSGNIIAMGNNAGPWDFEWRDSNNTLVKTSYNRPSADTLTSLSSGNYTIKINTTGQCDLYNSNISINQIVLPFANFTTNTDTIYFSNNTQFLITNNSLNCTTYDWNFGDLSPHDNSISPYHIYTTAGTFSITLITESISNCIDSTKNKIVVINDITNTTNISEIDKSYSLLYYQNSNSYCLKINLKENSSIDIKIFDISGQLIVEDKLLNIKNKNYTFNLEDKADGIYFLQVTSDRGDSNSFKIKK